MLERAKEVRILTVVNEKELSSESLAAELSRYDGTSDASGPRLTGGRPDVDHES
jgi:hypothetical protein